MKRDLRDQDILDLLRPHMDASRRHQSELSLERERFMRAYRAEPYGNERDGFAKTVHPTVFTAVEWMKPGLYEVFTGDFFSLRPQPCLGDPSVAAALDAAAKRLKTYIREKLFLDNEGGQVIEDFIHDCLTSHFGAIKVSHREERELVSQTVTGVPCEELDALSELDPTVVSISRGKTVTAADPVTGEPVNFCKKATIKRERIAKSGFAVETVPPHELFFPSGYKSLQDCPFVAHVVRRDLDHVRRMELSGVYRKGAYDAAVTQIAVRNAEPATMAELASDYAAFGLIQPPSQVFMEKELLPANEVLIWECYVKLDLDGSGLLTPAVVTVCGEVVLREPMENPYGGPPFELGSIFKEPHMMIGRPVAATLEHRQRILTNLLRNIQDGAALSTYRGFLTADMQTKKRLEALEPGAVAWVPNLSQVQPIEQAAPSPFILNAFNLTLQEVSKESGINENQMGLDNNALNRTAAGMQMRLSAGQMRQKLYAHRLARTFRKVIARIIDTIRLFPPGAQPGPGGTRLMPGDEALGYSIEIEIGVGPQDRLSQAQAMSELIGVGLSAGQALGIMDPAGLSRAIKAKYDYLDMDVSEFLAPEDGLDRTKAMQARLDELTGENAGLRQALLEHIAGLRKTQRGAGPKSEPEAKPGGAPMSGQMPGPTSGPMSGPKSGQMPRPMSGPLSGQLPGEEDFHAAA